MNYHTYTISGQINKKFTMKNIILSSFFFIFFIAAVSCNEKIDIGPGTGHSKDTTTTTPIGTDGINFCFVEDTACLQIAEGWNIDSVYCVSDWISAEWDNERHLYITVEFNYAGLKRSDILYVHFGNGETHELLVEQNARPKVQLDFIDYEFYDSDKTCGAIYFTLELGEGVSDIRMFSTYKYVDETNPYLLSLIVNMNINEFGPIYTLDDYERAIDEEGVFKMEFTDGIWGLRLNLLLLDSEHNFDGFLNYPWLI